MKIDHQVFGTVDVWTPEGALVDEDAERFITHLRKQCDGPNPRFVVSMQEVPYMDSQALEGLLDVADEMQSRSTWLKLVAVASTCREIFELTGYSDRFQYFEAAEDAVRSFI